MKERLAKRLGEAASEVYVSTFHALSLNIIRKFGKSIGYAPNLSVLDEDDQQSLMAQCSRSLGYDLKKEQIKSICYACNDARENLSAGSDFSTYFRDSIDAEIAKEYLSRMKANNQIDFSGILSETVELLNKDPEVLQRLVFRFEFLQVDEAQDCNVAQHKIARMLGSQNNIFMVGDLDQSIYTWRGASPESVEKFIEECQAKVIELPMNYRSTPEIVSTASKLIRKNAGRESAQIKTTNKSGAPVMCKAARDPDSEASWIGYTIEKLVREQNYKFDQIAVLYRANSMSRAIEQAFTAEGIPHQVIGGMSFYKRTEVKDVLAMLRFFDNPYDGTALDRFINKPTRSIGEVTLGKIETYAAQNKISLIEALEKSDSYLTGVPKLNIVTQKAAELGRLFGASYPGKDIGTLMRHFVSETGYYDYIEKKFADKADEKKSNVDELISSASVYAKKSGNNISEYLGKIALMSSADKNSAEGCVTLMTMHAAKGLEFPVVFLPRLESGQIPHIRSLDERGIEEERRLCYVAMTRAEKLLICSWSKETKFNAGRGLRSKHNRPSPFLFEAEVLREGDILED